MRPQNESARARLSQILRVRGWSSASSLAQTLGISIPTLHRILQEHETNIVRTGVTKYARYAWRRALRGTYDPIPVYAIDAHGQGQALDFLHLVEPQGSVFNLVPSAWPIDREHLSGAWEGLPYPLYDMRPQGYLGRKFARAFSTDLDVPTDPEAWSDDHIVYALSRRGNDTPGNLIIGYHAYQQWLENIAHPETIIPPDQLPNHYAALATEAISLSGSGSSAGGEFPKFTAQRALPGSTTPHVIVKFSGADASLPVQRWADLLVCEHLALETLKKNRHLKAASSRIIQSAGRTFLEVERFDRCGTHGRLPLISLTSLDAVFSGKGSGDWPTLVQPLIKNGLLPETLLLEVETLWWFGRLIANNDMHPGNLSFQLIMGEPLHLSPAYDMLPMLYAPLSGGEIPPRQFAPTLPHPHQTQAWEAAYPIALDFWQSAASDDRISPSFRKICQENLQQLHRLSTRP
ncbi:HipA-like N-terminal domain-containing protein [Methylophilus rhizosphaerae]|uniref:HipA-like N-terminal domain-containing protein n=1 Tax=Methylophilus rhizosphaerae TaxID=492660 RepID=A0A1G8Z9V7_9PROT|nr:type II toxin-antitoxin system HipA family toxin YjjJ [Methylophilus rhizosphaerae]SDK11763.1 HipA-like N-terminal domain-containing protein [Methylophilus rhizosphaerae]